MLRINPGPNIARFAQVMECTVDQVLEWANIQLNDPMEFYSREYPTDEDRLKAIKGYILWVLDYDMADKRIGINDRIRSGLNARE